MRPPKSIRENESKRRFFPHRIKTSVREALLDFLELLRQQIEMLKSGLMLAGEWLMKRLASKLFDAGEQGYGIFFRGFQKTEKFVAIIRGSTLRRGGRVVECT